MIEQSPALALEVQRKRININTQRSLIRDNRTLSHLTTVTGDTPGARAAAEGLNAAAIICDEAHVVDSRTVEIVKDAGASQEQFLWFQISTFGNTTGYGKNDLDLGRDVASGRVKDDGFFFKSYEAPQDASDAECMDEATWKAANPNYGFTVHKRQFSESCARAAEDPAEFASFKQRRLNIWQRASNPMVKYELWKACAADITWDSLLNVGGGTGLDLAATEDWAAVAHCWEQGEKLALYVKMWTSQEWIDEHRHLANFESWSQNGFIEVHDGGSIDFGIVEDEVRALLKHTKSRCLGYDKMFGMQMAQSLDRRVPRVKIYSFAQSIASYAGGTAEFKSAVKNGLIAQPNNPALDWQMGHVQSIRRGDYEKPVKDEDAPWKKIDAVQAIVTAIDVKKHVVEHAKPWVGFVTDTPAN